MLLQNARYCSEDDTFHRKVIDIIAVREVLDKAAEKAVLAEQYARCGLLDLPLRKKFIYLAWVLLVWLISAIIWGNFREGVIGGVVACHSGVHFRYFRLDDGTGAAGQKETP